MSIMAIVGALHDKVTALYAAAVKRHAANSERHIKQYDKAVAFLRQSLVDFEAEAAAEQKKAFDIIIECKSKLSSLGQ